MKKNKQWDIRGAVGLAAFFHFLHSFASGCLMPFLTLYFRHLGLSAFMTGIIMAAKHIVALVWRPISSILARRHNKRRTVITGSIICSTAVALTLLLLPPMDINMESEGCNISQQNSSHTALVFDHTTVESWTVEQNLTTPTPVVYSTEHNITSTLDGNDTNPRHTMPASVSASTKIQDINATQKFETDSNKTSNQTDQKEPLEVKTAQTPSSKRRSRSLNQQDQKQKETYVTSFEFLGSLKVMDVQHQMFFLVLIVVSLWEITAVPLLWTADDGLHEYLDFVDSTDRHGLVKPWRLLGTAGGMGGSGILVTILYCLVGPVLHFYTYAVLMVLTVPVAVLLPLYRHKRERVPKASLKALQLVKADSRALFYSITALLTGMAGSVIFDFLLWQMQDLGATELQMGITLALTPLCQAAFSPLNIKFTRLVKTHDRLLLLGVLGLSLQCLYYSFLWTPWVALPAQLLAGLSTGVLWWSLEAQCMDIASPGTEVAVQRVFEALYLDLGAALGSVAGGFVVQTFGVRVLFQGTAVMLALWCTALAVLQWRIPRQRRVNYSRLLAADSSDMSESESEQETDWLEKAMEEQ
ncbi:major facilitator superfamily domain-containing protein 6-like [Trichomycterus rosablanca]|uniref:major facilitator superfamily domain-containing protein 6-like n=1 Tax=Trichomycterus rosablanca TaxID=2290929 RepID=UPI002F3525C3